MNVYFEDSIVAVGSDVAKVLEKLEISKRSAIKTVVAAGGLARNERGDALMILRCGRWDLPKGHVDPGESLEEGALREVAEECGIGDLRLGQFLCTTYHIYDRNGWTLKQTHWYAMWSDDLAPVPQTSEWIERAEWVPADEVAGRLAAGFRMIGEVFEAEHCFLGDGPQFRI